jgi:hypothetical protein
VNFRQPKSEIQSPKNFDAGSSTSVRSTIKREREREINAHIVKHINIERDFDTHKLCTISQTYYFAYTISFIWYHVVYTTILVVPMTESLGYMFILTL